MKAPTEAALLKQCLEWLRVRRVWHVRLNSGAFVIREAGRSSRFFRAGVKGLSDLLVVVRGRALFAELKGPRGRQNEAQAAFAASATAAGALYVLVKSLDDLVDAVEVLSRE